MERRKKKKARLNKILLQSKQRSKEGEVAKQHGWPIIFLIWRGIVSVFSVLLHKLRAYSSSLGQGGGKGKDPAVGPDRCYPGQWKWFVSFPVCVVLFPPD